MRPALAVCALALLLVPVAAAAQWRDRLNGVRIPNSPAGGRIRGEAFKVERAELQGTHLRLRQGKGFFSDREILVLFNGKQSDLSGKDFTVNEDMGFGSDVPNVHMSWMPKGARLPKTKMYMEGYLMRLELGRIQNGRLPGRIYLCLPDFKRSFVA